MVDTHYDLLSIAYCAYLSGNYAYLEKVSKYFHENNVNCVFANLYFMSKEEMVEELHPKYYQEKVSVLEMFQKAKEVLDCYLPDTEILYSIEGADFITGPEELEKLYDAGCDALILCWNTESKYASGNRSDKGLTKEGRELIEKAISLGMGVDLSHANEATFYDLINLVKEKQASGEDVCVYASHSNARSLCDRDRNLTDDQLEKIKEVNGFVGVFSNKNFVVKPADQKPDMDFRSHYLEHIHHIGNIVGLDNVMVATDDMDFCAWADPEYGQLAIYEYGLIVPNLILDLIKEFDMENAKNIIYGNAKEKIYNPIKSKRNEKEKDRGVK